MKRTLAALLIVLTCMVFPAGAAETVKVLILDERFGQTPEEGEELTLLDKVNGSLHVGYSNYSGDIEVWKGQKGLYIINDLPLEEYVEGVVKAETGQDWAMEALKAQAVVVRTYVLQQKRQNQERKYHVTSTVLHQLYRGKNTDTEVSAACKATEGEILTHQGEPIVAFYHSTSGGTTELPEEVFGRSYPYLTSVSSSCKLSPYSAWIRRISFEELQEATGVTNLKDVQVASLTATGRVKELTLVSNPKRHTFKATELRKLLGWKKLPSTSFTLQVDGHMVRFEGKGYGHGVGLCQWSALEMARNGKTYRDILSFFYPGATLQQYNESR